MKSNTLRLNKCNAQSRQAYGSTSVCVSRLSDSEMLSTTKVPLHNATKRTITEAARESESEKIPKKESGRDGRERRKERGEKREERGDEEKLRSQKERRREERTEKRKRRKKEEERIKEKREERRERREGEKRGERRKSEREKRVEKSERERREEQSEREMPLDFDVRVPMSTCESRQMRPLPLLLSSSINTCTEQ